MGVSSAPLKYTKVYWCGPPYPAAAPFTQFKPTLRTTSHAMPPFYDPSLWIPRDADIIMCQTFVRTRRRRFQRSGRQVVRTDVVQRPSHTKSSRTTRTHGASSAHEAPRARLSAQVPSEPHAAKDALWRDDRHLSDDAERRQDIRWRDTCQPTPNRRPAEKRHPVERTTRAPPCPTRTALSRANRNRRNHVQRQPVREVRTDAVEAGRGARGEERTLTISVYLFGSAELNFHSNATAGTDRNSLSQENRDSWKKVFIA
jgi:hypothetical protein